MQLLVSEVLDRISRAPTREEKMNMMRHFSNHNGFLAVLKGAFDKSIKWLVSPDIDFKYSSLPVGLTDTTLTRESRRFYLFCEVNGKVGSSLSQKKRDLFFKRVLESIHASEADVLLDMVRGKLKIDGVDVNMIKEVFPGLLAEESSGGNNQNNQEDGNQEQVVGDLVSEDDSSDDDNGSSDYLVTEKEEEKGIVWVYSTTGIKHIVKESVDEHRVNTFCGCLMRKDIEIPHPGSAKECKTCWRHFKKMIRERQEGVTGVQLSLI